MPRGPVRPANDSLWPFDLLVVRRRDLSRLPDAESEFGARPANRVPRAIARRAPSHFRICEVPREYPTRAHAWQLFAIAHVRLCGVPRAREVRAEIRSLDFRMCVSKRRLSQFRSKRFQRRNQINHTVAARPAL